MKAASCGTFMFVRTLPISYHTFSYERFFTKDRCELQSQLRKDIVDFVFNHLEAFRGFDRVAIYYNGGQKSGNVRSIRRF